LNDIKMNDIYVLTSTLSVVFYAVPLAVIVAVTVVRAGVMSWRLLGGARPRVAIERLLDGSVSADEFARAALTNRISTEPLSEERLTELRTGPRVQLDKALRTLRAADVQFNYLWQRMAIRVSSTWNLMRLTLLAAGLITTGEFFQRVEYFSYGDRIGITIVAGLDQAMYKAGVWALAQLALGFAVAGVLCVVALVFDGLLQRRLASWKYFYATERDALSDGQKPSSSER
jgi:hypothetical protein